MLKVNDIVRVREDLQVGKCGNNNVVDKMLYYRGDYGYISNMNNGYITCDFDCGEWTWNEEMLELVPGFKMGGKVLIKNNFKVGDTYGDVDVVIEMAPYFGKEATIIDIDVDGDVYLDIDNGQYVWSLDMLLMPLEEAVDPIDYKEEYTRLVEDVNEYEGIIASLEDDLHQARKDNYHLIQEYNVLVEKYNSLLEELKEDYI